MKWMKCGNAALPLPQTAQTSSNELPSGHRLRLQQPDVREWPPGAANPAGVQAPGDGQSEQAPVCSVEPQQSVSANQHALVTHDGDN